MFSILLAAALFIVAIFIYSSWVAPEYERITALRGEYGSKLAVLDNQRQIVNKVNSLLTKYRSIPDLRNVISMALPSTEDVASAFSQLYAMSLESGAAIAQFGASSGNAVQSGSGGEILKSQGAVQVSLHLIGNYNSIKNFIGLMERNIRLMDLVSLKLQPLNKSTQDIYVATLVINAYYQTD